MHGTGLSCAFAWHLADGSFASIVTIDSLHDGLCHCRKSLVLGVVTTLVAALPAWSAETFDFVGEAGLEPSLADTPHIIEALMFTLIMYFTIILLWVWVSSFADEVWNGKESKQVETCMGSAGRRMIALAAAST